MNTRKRKIFEMENKLRLWFLPLLFPLVMFSCVTPVHELGHCHWLLHPVHSGAAAAPSTAMTAHAAVGDHDLICLLCAWRSGATGALPFVPVLALSLLVLTTTFSTRVFALSSSPSTFHNRGPPRFS
jgi:hypothetical protein